MKSSERISTIAATCAVGCVFGASERVIGHHSFASEFSRDLPVQISGTVSKVEWTNPHARFYVEVDEDGDTVTWDFELTSPNVLMRRGWRRDSLKPGDRITVTGWRARNHPRVANASGVTTSDGTALFTGSAGNSSAE